MIRNGRKGNYNDFEDDPNNNWVNYIEIIGIN